MSLTPKFNPGKINNDTMKRLVKTLLILCCPALLAPVFTSCSADDDGDGGSNRQEVRILISAPAEKAGRVPDDPGSDVEEGHDWDKLAVMFVYSSPDEVYMQPFSKEDYEKAAPTGESGRYKALTMTVRTGNAYVLGVTYHSEAAGVSELETALKKCRNMADVRALTISNDYAKGDNAKFVSVATGYFTETTDGGLGTVTVSKTEDGKADVNPVANITLTRLASKIDIQYDAENSYNNHYTDVGIPDFSFYGTASGYLFPKLNTEPLPEGGRIDFINKTTISQRNGRVYHYTFTDGQEHPEVDGKKLPYVDFHITAKNTQDGGQTVKRTHQLRFPVLEQAAWYKGNLTVSGLSTADKVITVTPQAND